MLRADQLPYVESHCGQLVGKQTPEVEEGGRVAHNFLRLRHHFADARVPTVQPGHLVAPAALLGWWMTYGAVVMTTETTRSVCQ